MLGTILKCQNVQHTIRRAPLAPLKRCQSAHSAGGLTGGVLDQQAGGVLPGGLAPLQQVEGPELAVRGVDLDVSGDQRQHHHGQHKHLQHAQTGDRKELIPHHPSTHSWKRVKGFCLTTPPAQIKTLTSITTMHHAPPLHYVGSEDGHRDAKMNCAPYSQHQKTLKAKQSDVLTNTKNKRLFRWLRFCIQMEMYHPYPRL